MVEKDIIALVAITNWTIIVLMEVTGILTQWIIALLVSSNLANGYSFRNSKQHTDDKVLFTTFLYYVGNISKAKSLVFFCYIHLKNHT